MEDFKKLIKEKENPRRKGFDSKSKTWKPHKSAEGGTDTIGWLCCYWKRKSSF